MKAMRRVILPLLLCIFSFAAGCHNAGVAPQGWTGSPYIDEAEYSLNDSGKLQVFICYGVIFSNHTALRLETPERPTLMWDPGGTFKQDDPEYARKYDVLTRNAPSVEQWWYYRGKMCNEPTMHMYEWSIDAEQADRLRTILLTRYDPLDETQEFWPDANGLACCRRVSQFLMRFADGRPDVNEIYFWPHKLGEHLWTQHPDRVVIFKKNGPITGYQLATDSPPVN